MSDQLTNKILEAINQIEESYEFMLAYAAQGRQNESDTEGASQIRGFLQLFQDALTIIDIETPRLLPAHSPGADYADHLLSDSKTMSAILDLLLGRENITSDMVDNTNGMISVRSFLSNLFFIDQVIVRK
jgi:hypothetical protein